MKKMELTMNYSEAENLEQAVDNKVSVKMQETLHLLSRGEKEVILREKYKDVVLIFGNTGSGKSTIAQWLAGDSSKLIATEVQEGFGEFIIKDGNNRIGNSTIESKTIFPELIVNSITNTAYYDCPGFSNTRSTSHDIAITYFNKKVADWAKRVKLIFVINYSSVRIGVDRQDFMTLLRHATDMVKDFGKFRNSIAIIVTKVNNQYVKKGKRFILIDDDIVVNSIADFFKKVKQDLEEKSKLSNIPLVEQNFYRNAIQFIDALLVKHVKIYTKIGIFRIPDQSGPISNIPWLNEEKKYVQVLIHEILRFTEKDLGDFGYTISEKTKNHISEVMDKIAKIIWSTASDIASKVEAHFHDLVEKIRDKIKSFMSSTFVDAHQEEAEALSTAFNNGYNATLNMFHITMNLKNPEKFAENINQTVTILHINVSEGDILNILEQGRYFNFLQDFYNRDLNWKPWAELFKGTVKYLVDSRKNIQDDIDRAAGIISKHITLFLNETAKDIQSHYIKKIKSLDVQELLIVLSNAKYAMYNMVEDIKKIKTLTGILRTIQNVTDYLGIALSKDNLQNILNEINYISFMEILNGKELNLQSFEWGQPFNEAFKNLSELEEWNTFLNNLYAKFSDYEIQKDKDHYVSIFENWGMSGNTETIKVAKNNFELFLNKTSIYNLKYHKNIYNITVTSLQLEELNKLLNLTLKRSLDKSCSGPGELAIKGENIVVSHFIGTDGKINLDSGCGKLTAINIFALNRVFIDRDITLPGMKISIISPKWEIIGNRTIDLSGTNGEPYYEVLSPGEDGEPGKPGKPGGTFFGIGDKFVNGEKLTILTNGGDGGSGQNGGDGRRGQNGLTPTIPSEDDLLCKVNLCKNYKKINDFDCIYVNYVSHYDNHHSRYSNNDPRNSDNSGWVYECENKILGKPGEKGGDGGNSGRGGKGGFPGSITIIELGGGSGILKYSNKGRDGKPGIAGTGGVGGINGDDIDIVYHFETWKPAFSKWILKEKITKEKLLSGRNGTLGANNKNIQDPEVAGVIDQANIINEFKCYLRENINNRYKNYFLLTFLDQINTVINVNGSYYTLELVNELRGLEEQFHKLHQNVDLAPFYKQLLNRINQYAQNPQPLEKSNKYKKVLSYLYTATLGRISYLKHTSDSNLIVDINGYLAIVENDIQELLDLQRANIKSVVINRYKDIYKNYIDKKILEAKYLIEHQIKPEMDSISTQINDSIGMLIDEIIKCNVQFQEGIKELNGKKQELIKTLELKGLFSVFQMFGQITSFLVPIGASDNSAIGTDFSTAEPLLIDSKSYQHQIIQVPYNTISGLQSVIKQIKTAKNKKINHLNKLLEQISEEINKYPKMLGDISKKINGFKIMLNKIDRNRIDFKEVQILEDEINQELYRKIGELKFLNINTNKEGVSEFLMSKFRKITGLRSVLLDIIDKHENDKSKIDAINDAIEKSENNLQKLKVYQDEVKITIAPMLQNMADTFEGITEKHHEKSQISLDVTKWHMQRSLTDMKLLMQKKTEMYEINDDIEHCLENLEEAMTILINVYDRIQDYQQLQSLANHIAYISSPYMCEINIPDSNLINAVNKLEIVIRSNLVLQLYKTAVDTFKQVVFPFAHIYFSDSMQPLNLKLEGNIKNLVVGATIQLDKIKSQLDKYRTSLMENDKFINTAEFRSDYVSTKPFYVWKNDRNKKMILKLMSGQDVVVKADILDSLPNRFAVRLSSIDLNFKAKNDTIQYKINNLLKTYELYVTHLGNSYYSYKDKIYLITSNSQTIHFSFERNELGEPLIKNKVYDKIMAGDCILSPYAMWKLMLISSTNKSSFDDLAKYGDGIDLELIGTGSYVDQGVELFLEDYYQPIGKYDELHLNYASEMTDAGEATISNMRYTRAVRPEGTYYLTNSVTSGFSSPINHYCNLFKKNILKIASYVGTVIKQLVSITETNLDDTNINNNFFETAETLTKISDITIEVESKNQEDECSRLINNGKQSRDSEIVRNCYFVGVLKVNGGNPTEHLSEEQLPKAKNRRKPEILLRSSKDSSSTFQNISKFSRVTSNSSKFIVSACRGDFSNSYSHLTSDCTDYITKLKDTSGENHLGICHECSGRALETGVTVVDMNSNLTFGQLIVHKIFGTTKSLRKIHYMSPELEYHLKLSELESQVLPVLGNDPFMNEHDYFTRNCSAKF